jgi:hypothetical protein
VTTGASPAAESQKPYKVRWGVGAAGHRRNPGDVATPHDEAFATVRRSDLLVQAALSPFRAAGHSAAGEIAEARPSEPCGRARATRVWGAAQRPPEDFTRRS